MSQYQKSENNDMTMMRTMIFLFLFTIHLFAADWPQWRGINRDGKSPETDLLGKWPEGGPNLIWSFTGLGKGLSAPSIVNNTVYVLGSDDDDVEYLFAIDPKGQLKYQRPVSKAWSRSYSGARSAPTINEGKIYIISSTGVIACFEQNSGKKLWSVNGLETFGGEFNRWGLAESPLLVDDKVIYTPCGDQTTMVALDRKTGETVWQTRSLNESSAFVSPALISDNGQSLIVGMTANSVLGIHPETADIVWTYDYTQHFNNARRGRSAHAITPLYHHGKLFVTSGYDHDAIMLDLSKDLSTVRLAWANPDLDCHHGGVVLVDGYLYGSAWQSNRDGNWACLDWTSGKTRWQHNWHTKGSIIYADKMLYCMEEKSAHVALVKPNPEKFDMISSFQVPKGTDQPWAHPAISNGRLYIRWGDVLYVYDIEE
jgi:outer membrane protein assembly factor BamB